MKQCTRGTYGFRFYQAVSRVIFDTDLVATRLILALAENLALRKLYFS